MRSKERFDVACTYLQFQQGAQKFDTFSQCIAATAEVCWNGVLNDVPINVPRDNHLFDECFREYLQRYMTERGCDYMVEYLTSLDVKKPHDIKCDIHAERIRTLVRYTNMLAGTVPQIDEQAEK